MFANPYENNGVGFGIKDAAGVEMHEKQEEYDMLNKKLMLINSSK